MSAARVGDLVRFRAQYLCPAEAEGARFIRNGYETNEPLFVRDGESQGIVLEVRDDGLFVQEAPAKIGDAGEGKAWVCTHSTLVAFDDVIAVVPNPAPSTPSASEKGDTRGTDPE